MKEKNKIEALWGSIVIIKESECKNRNLHAAWGSTIIVIPDDFEYDGNPGILFILETAEANAKKYHESK